MRSLRLSVSIVLALVAVTMASDSVPNEKQLYNLSEAPKLFEDFIKDFNRQYKDDADREIHYRAFTANLEKINKLREQSTSANYGINKFADYTEEERKTMFGHGIRKE